MRRSKPALTHSTSLILLMMLAYAVCLAQKDGDPISIGTYRVIHSDILKEDRLLYIHLPEGYQDTQQR